MDNNEVVVAEEVAAVAENNTGIEIEPLFEEQVDFDTFSKSDFRVVKVKNCEAVPKSKKLLRFKLDDGTENERTILSGVHAFYLSLIHIFINKIHIDSKYLLYALSARYIANYINLIGTTTAIPMIMRKDISKEAAMP